MGGKARPSGEPSSAILFTWQQDAHTSTPENPHGCLHSSDHSAFELGCIHSFFTFTHIHTQRRMACCITGAAGKVSGHEKLLQTLHQQPAGGRARHSAILLTGCYKGSGGVSPAEVTQSCSILGLHFRAYGAHVTCIRTVRQSATPLHRACRPPLLPVRLSKHNL